MDAHDLFKKLTKGAIFTKKKKEVLNIEKQDSRILKEEPKELEQDLGDSEDYSQADFDESEEDEGITLLAGFDKATGEKIKKKKSNISESNKEAQLHKEHINRIRNEHHINVNGKSPVEPIVNFTELNEKYKVSQKLLDNLTKCGYSQPTPIQMQAMPVLINERNIMGCAPTGSGKTAAFLVPIIHQLKQPMKQGFRCVILCPTRELASQTKRECERLTESIGLRVFSIDKISQAENKFGPNSNKKFDILVTTPNRICHLLDMDRPILDLSNVKWLVLDEADKLFEEGLRSFREQFDKIYLACSKQDKVVALLSATWTQSVSKWCQSHLKRLLTITIGQRNSVTEQVEQELLFVGTESGKLLAIRDIIRKGVHPPVLVFVQSKDRAQQLFKELIYDGINVDVIHADRTQQQRDNCVRSFREGKIWVLICTELMGRGIDFKGVNLVINYDFPQSAISYIHRIGRTGRAGRKGKAITFFTKEDTTNLRRIAQLMKDSGCNIPEYMLSLKKHSKKERRKLEKFAPERDDITTNPKILAKNAKEKAAKRPAADKLKKNKSKMLKLSNEDD